MFLRCLFVKENFHFIIIIIFQLLTTIHTANNTTLMVMHMYKIVQEQISLQMTFMLDDVKVLDY